MPTIDETNDNVVAFLNDGGEDIEFAYAAGYELGVLGAEVEDDDRLGFHG